MAPTRKEEPVRNMSTLFRRITIIGIGLIGGSLGLRIRQKKLADKVVGVVRRKSSLEKALDSKAVDEVTTDLAQGIGRSEIVVIATPVGSIVEQVKSIIPLVKPGTVITDVGSAKAEMIGSVEKILPKGIFFVGGHPLAGSEKTGVENARADLFEKTIAVLTTTPKTNPRAFRKIRDLWEGLGIEVRVLSPNDHDLILARTSHIPHLAAFSLVASLQNGDESFVASGFRDATRVAASDPVMWRDILMANKKAVLKGLKGFNSALERLRTFIEKGDEERLLQELEKLQSRREKL